MIGYVDRLFRFVSKTFAIFRSRVFWNVLMDQFDLALNAPIPEPSCSIWVTGSKLPCQLRYRSRTPQSTLH